MIIGRHTFTATEGRMGELMDHLKWWVTEFVPPPHYRTYSLSTKDDAIVLAQDELFEDREQWRAHADKVRRAPGFEEAIGKLRELSEIKFELWEMADQG